MMRSAAQALKKTYHTKDDRESRKGMAYLDANIDSCWFGYWFQLAIRDSESEQTHTKEFDTNSTRTTLPLWIQARLLRMRDPAPKTSVENITRDRKTTYSRRHNSRLPA